MSSKFAGAILGVWVWICLSQTATANPAQLAPLDTLWQSASDTATSWEMRKRLYEEWNAVAASYGVRSDSAYRNLAYGAWKAEDFPSAIENTVLAAETSGSFLQTLSYLRDLKQLETRLGNKDQLSREWGFRSYILAGPNLRLLLAVLCFWILLLGALRYLFPKLNVPPAAMVGYWSFAIVLCLCSVLLHLNRRAYPKVGILKSSEGSVQTFTDGDPEKPLVKLPSGTLVRILKQKNTTTQIDFPVAAWVDSQSVAKLLPNP
ncbi:MAG: hypothetical protein R3B54_12740 [Bdellovibrionota bacterium]